jgi:hypothetical protein
MKTFVLKQVFSVMALLVSVLGALPLNCEASKIDEIRLSISNEWGRPIISQYDQATKTGEWRYIRKEATLIVTKAECAQCKEISQADVDAIVRRKGDSSSAILLNHKGLPALLRLFPGAKEENLRAFQLHANGFRYEIQLGIDHAATQAVSFNLELDFLEMINGLNP